MEIAALQYYIKPVEGSLYLQTNKVPSSPTFPLQLFNLPFSLIVNCG